MYIKREGVNPFNEFLWFIHAYQESKAQFTDTFVEWSRSNYAGRVKAAGFFNDQAWHCWDSTGNDVVCP